MVQFSIRLIRMNRHIDQIICQHHPFGDVSGVVLKVKKRSLGMAIHNVYKIANIPLKHKPSRHKKPI
ncbi:MAG TPA: hypothetical protein DCE42_00095 [Myxococcales bacterium]|nr:hypothetical protein [Deltaproteobacteria bacterium]MBU50828.1 hypothetical protein [Deltaproteobacteria bacterium]HAA53121.1 hypothetical protein [Myxococcales bacterium]